MNGSVKLLKVTNDFVFKALFGREEQECKIILMDFLNVLLKLKGKDEIEDITYLNPFNLKEFQADKLSILDIKVKTVSGERINIEMQVSDADNYRKRSLYYWCKLYAETIGEAETYSTLKKSIVINIVDFNLLHETEEYHSIFKVMENNNYFLLTDDLEIHYVELGKFDDAKNIDEMSELEQWITFIKNTGNEGKEQRIEMIKERSGKIKMAMDMLGKISADELMRQKYLDREKARLDQKSQLYYARKQRDIEIAKNLLSMGLDIDKIAQATGLSISEIVEFKEQLGRN